MRFSRQATLSSPLHCGFLVTRDNNTFRDPYAAALKAAGAQVVTATEPDEARLSHADVVLIHREKFEAFTVATQAALTAFTQRGGGIVAIAAGDVAWRGARNSSSQRDQILAEAGGATQSEESVRSLAASLVNHRLLGIRDGGFEVFERFGRGAGPGFGAVDPVGEAGGSDCRARTQ